MLQKSRGRAVDSRLVMLACMCRVVLGSFSTAELRALRTGPGSTPTQQWPHMHHPSSICSNIGPFCQTLPSSNDELLLRLCTTSEEPLARQMGPAKLEAFLGRTGAFVFERMKNLPAAGHDVFRVRLVGHEILLLDTHLCNQSMVVAPYQVLIGGTYHIECIHLFENFTLEAHPEPVPASRALLAEYDAMLVSNDETWGCAWDYTCPPCSGHEDDKGRRIARLPRLLGNASACIPQVGVGSGLRPSFCEPMVRSIAFNKSAVPGVEWQPYSCRLAGPGDIDMSACMNGRHVCTLGDSQLRHITMGVSALLKGNTSWHEGVIPAGDFWAMADKSLADPQFLEYISDAFGLSAIPPECTDVLMNFGQWPLSGVLDGRFWPLRQYQLGLDVAGEYLLSLREQGKAVWWVSTMSQTIKHGHTGKSDWRSDALVAIYNRLSHAHFTSLNIPIIDVFHVMNTLQEATYDGSHYKGLVGYNIDLKVLNVLCQAYGPYD